MYRNFIENNLLTHINKMNYSSKTKKNRVIQIEDFIKQKYDNVNK